MVATKKEQLKNDLMVKLIKDETFLYKLSQHQRKSIFTIRKWFVNEVHRQLTAPAVLQFISEYTGLDVQELLANKPKATA